MLKVGFDMKWELKKVDYTEWKQNNSGCYTLIYHVKNDIVRIDFMGIADSINPIDYPIISFQGVADNVRKAFMQWIDKKLSQQTSDRISCEHASYIGAELARCAILKENYVQD